MGPGVFAVSHDGSARRLLGDRRNGFDILPSHVAAEGVACRENAQRSAVVRINSHRFFQQRLGNDIVLARYAPEVRQRPHEQLPCIQALGQLAAGAETFGRVELRLDCRDDGLGDFILHGEHIRKLAVVAFRPQVASGACVVELRCDPHAIAASAHAALNHIADAELLGDLFHVDGFALVDEGRIAGDHENPYAETSIT